MTGRQMLAEIREQPDMLRELCRRAASEWSLPKSLFRRATHAVIVGSGSSLNAGLAARVYLESVAGVATRVDHASEAFRYAVPGRPLAIGFSHSGSSTDVRGALTRAKRQGCRTLALTNIDGSPLTRDADTALVTGAGVERAVPSTKGFTALVAASFLVASQRADSGDAAMRALRRAATVMETLQPDEDAVDRLARASSAVFLGQGLSYSVARDAALKLLEVTYIPSLAFPADEFRHGPIAIAEPGVVVVTVGHDGTSAAARAMDAVRAAGADVIDISPRPPKPATRSAVPVAVRSIVQAMKLQLLVHGVGVRLGRNIDNPRGLSKVVR